MSRKRKKTTSKSLIDIVITTAGRFDMLETCLESLYREAQTVPMTVTIVDIDTRPDERERYKHLFEYQPDKDPDRGMTQYQVVHSSTNCGFPAGANLGAKQGRSPIIMFLGDDVQLRDGAVQKVLESFKDETVGVVGIKLLFPENSTSPQRPAGKVQHVGLALNLRGVPIHPLNGWSEEHPKTMESRDAWAVTGACFSIRRELFNKAGGFDLIYGKGTFEDCDLCLKVRQMGKRIYLNANAVGYHYVGASAEKRREGFPLQQNLQIFQTRWGNSGLMQWDEFLYW